MHLAISLNECDGESVSFLSPTPNKVIQMGTFTHFLYMAPHFTTTGVHIIIDLKWTTMEPYFNKYKCSFDPNKNADIIEKIQKLENTILSQPQFNSKIVIQNISKHMQYGALKFFSNYPIIYDSTPATMRLVLNISGVWEADKYCGLTYKFIFAKPVMSD